MEVEVQPGAEAAGGRWRSKLLAGRGRFPFYFVFFSFLLFRIYSSGGMGGMRLGSPTRIDHFDLGQGMVI